MRNDPEHLAEMHRWHHRLFGRIIPCKVCERADATSLEAIAEKSEVMLRVVGLAVPICHQCTVHVMNAEYYCRSGGDLFYYGRLGWFEREEGKRAPLPKKVKISHRIAMQVFERDGYKCVHCGSQASLEPDHILPVSKGGGNEIENLQTACRPCNISRGNRVHWNGRKAVTS